jgi:hypothetical protein
MKKKIDLKLKIEQRPDGSCVVHFDKEALLKASLADLLYDVQQALISDSCSENADG